MSDDGVAWTGRIDRCADGSLVGELTDVFGFRLILTGKRDVEAGGYTLEARADEAPAGYRVAAIDDLQ